MNVREPMHMLRKFLSVGKLWNLAKAMTSYGLSRITKHPFAWGVPPLLMVEPTNTCNLKCPLCPTGNGTLRRRKGFMDLGTFRAVIDELRGKTMMLLMWNQGEPFLHGQFLDMVRHAADAGMYTMVSTNGHYFSDPEAIVRSGMDTLIVSLDGATAETYERYRVGGKFSTVIAGTRAVIEAKKKLGSKTPIVQVQFLLFKHNEREIQAVQQLAADLRADKITYKTAQVYSQEDVEAFLPEREELRRYEVHGSEFSLRTGQTGVPNKCRQLWLEPVLNWDGTISPCCFDKHGDFLMGSYGDGETLRSIWTSGRFNAFRRRVLQDRSQIGMCRNCTQGIKINYAERDIRLR